NLSFRNASNSTYFVIIYGFCQSNISFHRSILFGHSDIKDNAEKRSNKFPQRTTTYEKCFIKKVSRETIVFQRNSVKAQLKHCEGSNDITRWLEYMRPQIISENWRSNNCALHNATVDDAEAMIEEHHVGCECCGDHDSMFPTDHTHITYNSDRIRYICQMFEVTSVLSVITYPIRQSDSWLSC
uniref:Uncharacterized protein n=1 Tax=Parascaris univalens TaxID=6257 RepID=A0A915A3J8_PARUN